MGCQCSKKCFCENSGNKCNKSTCVKYIYVDNTKKDCCCKPETCMPIAPKPCCCNHDSYAQEAPKPCCCQHEVYIPEAPKSCCCHCDCY